MSTIVAFRAGASVHAPTSLDLTPPAYALRSMPMNAHLLDEVSREIVVLLGDHPEIASRFASFNIDALSTGEKAELLSSIKKSLSIRPVRRRNLGYVGP